jgi:hypothetical protein
MRGETGVIALSCRYRVQRIADLCRERGVPIYLLQLGQMPSRTARWKPDQDGCEDDPARWPAEVRGLRQIPGGLRVDKEVLGGDMGS